MLQLLVSLAAIIVGAELFVSVVETIAKTLGHPDARAGAGARAAGHRAAREGQQRPLGAPRQGQPRAGERQRGDGLPEHDPDGLRHPRHRLELDRYSVAAAAAGWLGAVLALYAVGRKRFGAVPAVAWAALFAAFLVLALTG